MDLVNLRPHEAPRVCLSCKTQKRKCDKALPSCSACQRGNRQCTYSYPLDRDRSRGDNLRPHFHSLFSPMRSVDHMLSDGVCDFSEDLSPPSSLRSGQESVSERSLSMFFLDTATWRHAQIPITCPHLSPPQELLSMLGMTTDINDIANVYFENVHPWFPIIWKRGFFSQTSLLQPPADTILLLACMKIVSEHPRIGLHPSCSPIYIFAKKMCAQMESSGFASTRLLQVVILLALYEIGHGIYPAAYLSVGHAAQVSRLLGFGCEESIRLFRRSSSWSECEEERRIRYSITVLDRFINAGFMGRPLCSQDFLPRDSLPCDTNSWDRGELAPSEPVFVTAATSVKTDSFGRLCQMGLLLGRILEHRDDKQGLSGIDRFENALQLNRTLRSLLSIAEKDFESSSSDYGSSVCLGFTAMVALHELYACTGTNRGTNTVQETEMQIISIKELKLLTAEIRSHLVQWVDKGLDLWDLGPLVCSCIYQAAATSAWYATESGDSWMQESHGFFLNALEQIKPRWAVAGLYLAILKPAEDSV